MRIEPINDCQLPLPPDASSSDDVRWASELHLREHGQHERLWNEPLHWTHAW